MSEEKQIEEMAKDLQETYDYEGCEAWHCGGCWYEKYGENNFCSNIMQAEKMTAKGYRKQRVGRYCADPNYRTLGSCSECGGDVTCLNNYCPNCGAKMKGGAE